MFTSQEIADSYDQIGLYFSATRPKLSAETIPLLPKLSTAASVLDLGCGNGVLLTSLPKGINYLGIDISKVLINEAKKNYPKQNFLIADINQNTTWKKLDTYDFIAALAIFHHLPTHPDHLQLFENIKKHLKPSGTALISVWRLDQPKFDKLRNGKHISLPFHASETKRDFYVFSQNELTNLAKDIGFTGIEAEEIKDNYYLKIVN